MQSDEPGTARGYLHDVLVDGAKPFRYRGGVRSLLGIPDGEGGQPTFAPTLPPVGFRYAHHELRAEAYWPTQPTTTEATHPALGSRAGGADSDSQDGTGENRLIRDTAQPRGVGPESRPEQITVEPGGAPQRSAVDMEHIGLEIPGVSEKRQPLPTSSPAKKDGALLDRRENWTQQGISPADLLKDSNTANTETPNAAGASQHDAPETKTAREKSAIRDTTQSPCAGAELEQKTIPIEPTAKPTPPGASIEPGGLEISGVSDKKQSLPALSPAKTDHTQAEVAETRPQRRDAPVRLRKHPAATSQAETQNSQPVQGNPVPHPPIPDRQGVEMNSPAPQTGLPTADAGPASTYFGEHSSTPERVKQDLAAMPGPANSATRRSVEPDQTFGGPDVQPAGNRHRMTQVTRPRSPTLEHSRRAATSDTSSSKDDDDQRRAVDPETVNRSNAAAADRIDQLRHSVHQLTAKVASQPGRAARPTEPPPIAQMPPPAQPVVVIQRPAPQAKTPRAFWERCYLSRFHLRTLR